MHYERCAGRAGGTCAVEVDGDTGGGLCDEGGYVGSYFSRALYFFVRADREHRDNVSVLPCFPLKGEKLTKRNTTGGE